MGLRWIIYTALLFIAWAAWAGCYFRYSGQLNRFGGQERFIMVVGCRAPKIIGC